MGEREWNDARAEAAWQAKEASECREAWTHPAGPDLPEHSDEYRAGWVTGYAAALVIADDAQAKVTELETRVGELERERDLARSMAFILFKFATRPETLTDEESIQLERFAETVVEVFAALGEGGAG